jgi:hypothetical protein
VASQALLANYMALRTTRQQYSLLFLLLFDVYFSVAKIQKRPKMM